MKIHHGRVPVKTTGRISVENVTDLVGRELQRSGIEAGFALVSVPHTTCGVALNEDERGLKQDIRRLADKLLDPVAAEGEFLHDRVDDNARAHLTSILLGHSVTVPVEAGRLQLGTWQSIFLIEMDGPRSRTLRVQILGA